MKLVSKEIRNFIDRQKLGFVSTCDLDGNPNVSPKGTISVYSENQLVFANIRSPDTITNLKINNKIEISIIDPILRKGFLFKGIGQVFSEGEKFDEIMKLFIKNKVKSPITSVVLVKILSIQPVNSPLYDLGYNEEEISKKWKKILDI
jgi:predicted pyridoxine 5'-phosphate oxidase superfamily flavin-nucleotide-binding protein